MAKIILWLVIIFAVLFVLRLINVAKAKARQPRGAGKPQSPSPMVRCVECGIYLPKADARAVSQGFHCGQVNCSQQKAGKP